MCRAWIVKPPEQWQKLVGKDAAMLQRDADNTLVTGDYMKGGQCNE